MEKSRFSSLEAVINSVLGDGMAGSEPLRHILADLKT